MYNGTLHQFITQYELYCHIKHGYEIIDVQKHKI